MKDINVNDLKDIINSLLEKAVITNRIREVEIELEQTKWRNKGLERQKKLLETSLIKLDK